ncbi:MAG: sulfatase-like hydrolase/transferase [Kiritimatiellae bacterium]|jgi:N-sulfoglucosamine sulfohydrolase|nr:sulfatase-like hydrolase/transferase [Kiritimatiellia bacterium]
MKTRKILIFSLLFALIATCIFAAEKPNILWITSEDNGRFLGCYGDKNAKTPNLDSLAEHGVRYENFYANAPVCSVARSSWILGMPAISSGIHMMRCSYRTPSKLVPYPTLLKQAGYYVTNHTKTDYNSSSFQGNIWDKCGKKAHYKNRKPGQPFFAVFNITISHESSVFPNTVKNRLKKGNIPEKPRVAAENIHLPPYQLRTPETIYDWQRMYDSLDLMDSEVGRLLKELENLGEAENTIIVYNSDHGGITLRSKRYLYDSGTRVPMIVFFPKKWKHLAPGKPGSVSTRLTQFLDMPRTFLSLCGAKIPKHYTGNIFLGDKTEAAPENILLFSNRFDECPDMRRAITDGRWKYIRNYQPDRPRYQMLRYIWNQEGQQSQFKAYKQGKTTPAQSAQFQDQTPEELFDTSADPHEVNNLAFNPQFSKQLKSMQEELDKLIIAYGDIGFMPEPQMATVDQNKSGPTIYEFAQDKSNYPLKEALKLANIVHLRNPENIKLCTKALANKSETIRCWGMMGLRMLGKTASPAKADVEKGLTDPAPSVRINAAITLGNLGDKNRACELLLKEAKAATSDPYGFWALDGIKYLDMPDAIKDTNKKDLPVIKGRNYTSRTWALLQNGGSMHQPGGPKW